MKNFFVLGLLVFILASGFIGCDTGNGSNNDNFSLSKMDIANATNLFIAPASAITGRSARNATSGNKLFKITEDGFVQEVTYFDDSGNSVTSSFSPTSIVVLNTNYLIVCFNYVNSNYLVNSNTGACYIYTNDIPNPDQNKNYYTGEYIGQDKNGGIYFISSPNGGYGPVKKLSVNDINNVNITTVSAPNDTVYNFGVDQDGNIAYEAKDSGNNNVLRFRRNSGGLEVLPGNVNHSFTTFWTGFSGKLYYWNQSNPGDSQIKELSAEPYTVTDYGDNDWCLGGSGFNTGIGIDNLFRIKDSRRIIGYNKTGVVELYNEQTNKATAIPISTFGLASIKFGIASDSYYYFAGTSSGTPRSVLIKIDPSNSSYTTLIDGGYDIYKMTVGDDDVITFNALQMSNGAIVVGQVSSSTDLEILDVALTQEVTVLERIR